MPGDFEPDDKPRPTCRDKNDRLIDLLSGSLHRRCIESITRIDDDDKDKHGWEFEFVQS